MDFENLIINTITEDLIKKHKNGKAIAIAIQEAWESHKQEKIPSGEYFSGGFFLELVFPKLKISSTDKSFIKTINASLCRLENRLENQYSKRLELISSLHKPISSFREELAYPLKWMKNDKQILKNMNKKKHKYFYDLFNCIIQSHTGLESSKLLASSNKTGKFIKNKKAYNYILYRPQSKYSDLKKRSELASLSQSKIYLYFRECVRHGIFIDKFGGRDKSIKQIRKDPKTKTKIYAIGYYLPFKEGFRRVYFLSKKRHLQSLRNFDAEYYKKHRSNKE